ncbi:MAG: DUF58 domain-containing protein [Gemmataceae bacterium]|nr:DUF58 domain-containing protein [Gemmataceae bacterium]
MLSHEAEAVPPGGRLQLTNEGLAWLAAAAVLGAVGWFKSLNLILLLAYAMAALLVVNGVLARLQVRRVRVFPSAPAPPTHAGEEVWAAVRVRNDSARPAVAVWVAGGPVRLGLVERLAPGQEAELGGRRAFPRRGRHRFTRPVIGSDYPFGFVRYDRPSGEPAEVVVLPAVGAIDAEGLRRWAAHAAGDSVQNRRVLRRATADQADVRGVRPYRPGDSLRWVHWRSSARRRELMVREYDAAPTPELVLAVEPWLPAKPTPADHYRLEAALSLAATVAKAWVTRLDGRVTLVVIGDNPVGRVISAGEAAARDGLIPLADATGAEAFPPVGAGAFGRAPRSAVRVLVSSRPNSPAAAELSRLVGRPFQLLHPGARPNRYESPWYKSPPGN